MARFTMTIQDIYQMYIWEDQVTLPDLLPATVMDYGTSRLFDFNYSTPVDKATFEDAFNKRYYLKEIGFESVDIFKMKLDYTLNINAPKYQLLYDGLLKDFSIRNVNSTTVTTAENGSGNSSNTFRRNTSDTKQINNNASATGNDRITGNQNQNQNNRVDTTEADVARSNQSTIFSDTPDNRLNNLTINPNNDRFALNYASTLQDNLIRQNNNRTGSNRQTATNAITNTQDQRTTSSSTGSQFESGQGLVNDSNTAQQSNNKNINQHTDFTYSADISSFARFTEVYQPVLKMILDDLEVLFMGIF